MVGWRGLGALNPAGGGVAEHRREVVEEASQARSDETFVAKADAELLDDVGDGAGVELPDGVELVGG
jgi:hypothetical protein